MTSSKPDEASPAALKTIHKYFDTALVDSVYFDALYKAVSKLGFRRDTSIALVNTCRDELARPIFHFFDENFGESFNLSGISGIVTAGVLGLLAGTSHAPVNENGRDKYVIFGSTHSAVDENGKEGAVYRAHQHSASKACGAIEQILADIKAESGLDGEIHADNLEYDTLKAKILSRNPASNATNFDLTKITADIIIESLESLLSKSVDPSKSDYVFFFGVQIHAGVTNGGPGSHVDYIAPVKAYASIEGKRIPFKLEGDDYVLDK